MNSSKPEVYETINLLRQCTSDGFLTADEITEIGYFLNERKGHRTEWPGNVLFPLLVSAFEDGQLSQAELEGLALQIQEIERQWCEHLASVTEHQHFIYSRQEPEADAPGELVESGMGNGDELKLPRLQAVCEIPASRGSGTYEVDLIDHTCTCPDWEEKRSEHPPQSLNRLCKHVAAAFAQHGIRSPEWLATIVSECAERNRGVYPSNEWKLIRLRRSPKPVLVGIGDTEWANVYFDSERFGFNMDERRWSYGQKPPCAQEIQKAILSF